MDEPSEPSLNNALRTNEAERGRSQMKNTVLHRHFPILTRFPVCFTIWNENTRTRACEREYLMTCEEEQSRELDADSNEAFRYFARST